MSNSAKSNNCTLDTCSIKDSVYNYRPSLAANALYLALFSSSLILHVAQGLRWRTWFFSIALLLGCLTEIIGYAGRLISWHNPFSQPGFLTQIICLTTAPAFFAAGIYFCISQIVITMGPEISRLSPKTYLLIFIPCDVVSLSLQGAGGGISSVQSQAGKTPTTGSNIMLAGLSFQVFTMTLFMTLCLEYGFRYRRAQRQTGYSSNKRTLGGRFKLFLAALALATICIWIRSIYRVIELAGGWDGKLLHDQTKFIVLEGVMVIVACLAFNIGHPGFALGKNRTWANDVDEKTEEA